MTDAESSLLLASLSYSIARVAGIDCHSLTDVPSWADLPETKRREYADRVLTRCRNPGLNSHIEYEMRRAEQPDLPPYRDLPHDLRVWNDLFDTAARIVVGG